MIAFIGGFVVCGILASVLYCLISFGIIACVKDRELAIAIYRKKTDTWEVTKTFDQVVQTIEVRKRFGRPGAVKYID